MNHELETGDDLQNLILDHVPIANEIVRQYVSSEYPFDDLQEYAYYHLTLIVMDKGKTLYGKNLEFYIRRGIRSKLLTYVSRERKLGTRSNITRREFEDCALREGEACDTVHFWNSYEKAIGDDESLRQIVELKIAGHSFREIEELLKVSRQTAHRHWSGFVKRMETYYESN